MYFAGWGLLEYEKDAADKVIGVHLGRGAPVDLLQQCYRKLTCSLCKRELWADEFHIKRRGLALEGPFAKFWPRRESRCIECERKVKKAQHRHRKAKRLLQQKQSPRPRQLRIVDPRKMLVKELRWQSSDEVAFDLKRLLTDFAAEVFLDET